MKRLLFFRLSVVICSFLAGNGFGAPNWGHYQHDNAHTGRTNVPVGPSNLALAWSAQNYALALSYQQAYNINLALVELDVIEIVRLGDKREGGKATEFRCFLAAN